tara:strand:- start:528 stop:749 length:222 start_codon:yes stop_codon:yes gene_type:complete
VVPGFIFNTILLLRGVNMKTFKIAVHDPAMVDYNRDILSDNTIVYSEFKKFNSRKDAEEWLLDYVEIIEYVGS